MAETAPLTSAHTHARKAAELQQLHFTQGAEEHQLASNDFARAAKATSDAEAFRVLRLLEEQHKRLAHIVTTYDEPQQQAATEDTKSAEPKPNKDATNTLVSSEKTSSKVKSSASASTNPRVGSQARDSSPSLARDIASRRGIPQLTRTQPSAAAQARARQLSPESRRRTAHGSAPKVPTSIVDSQANLQQAARASKKVEDDEGFAKFYSNLTSGTVSKLSSVLAYAGLPLTAEDAVSDQSSRQRPEKRTVSASNELDVKKIFSTAALNAIEDEHRRRGTLGHGFGPAESFYVVQKGGGTYSYADIARTQQQNQLSGVAEEEEAEFIDAKEVPGPPSPSRARRLSQGRHSFGNPRTQEELELENITLKQTLEQVAGRLSAFEAHAQDASMAALTQSMATLRPPQDGAGDPALQERLGQLEKQIEQQAEERQKLESLASKQEKMLKKYHSKWEEIKKSAKEKEKAKRERAEKGGDEGAAGEVSEAG